MKKVFYSIYTKIAISILCVICILCVATVGIDGLKKWEDYKSQVYMFEDKFEDSVFLSNMLDIVSYDIYNAAVQYITQDVFDVKENIENNLDSNHMDYYLSIDGTEFSNTDNKKQNHKYYYKLMIENGVIKEQMIRPERIHLYIEEATLLDGHSIEMYIGLKEQYVKTCIDLWTQQKLLVESTITHAVCWMLVAVACFFYMVLVVGKDENGNKSVHRIDELFIEFNLLLNAGIFMCVYPGVHLIVDAYFYEGFSFKILKFLAQVSVAILSSLSLVLLLSLVRNIKNKTVISRFLIYVILKNFVTGIEKLEKETTELISNFTSLVVIGVLFIYTVSITILGYKFFDFYDYNYYGYSGIICGLVEGILFIGFATIAIRYFNALNRIKKGVSHIRNGELDYKIEDIKFRDLDELKDGINDISDGLQVAVNKTLKAERLKTELITNVSHDLKTPLTSIINYTKLLADVENLPEEAKDYIAIIDKKSLGLKTLTQDLFDISKVQSGNDEIIIEKLNVETLLSQSLVEYEQEMEHLVVCLKIEEGLYIHSDGRKMSRVINNLLTNTIKYAMPNTRVFICAYSHEHKAIIEMKNISAYPLDFDKEEIMQRFKRGDESRSEEGNGLGLAIAKSYVEVTGGKFDIVLDGDLFKAIIEYEIK